MTTFLKRNSGFLSSKPITVWTVKPGRQLLDMMEMPSCFFANTDTDNTVKALFDFPIRAR